MIQFVKRVTNDNGAAAAAADFNIATSAGALTFGANTGTAQNAIYRSNSLTVNVGSYTMNEIDHPQYNEGTWSCTGVGTTQVGTAFNAGSVTLAQGAVATCSITNDDTAVADLSITKTNTPTVGALDQANDTVDSGQATTYTLVVTNDGTTAVTGAVVRDAPGAGITCPAGNAVTISGDGVPAGSFTVADLTGSTGIVLGALGAGQRATLSFNCQVN
ncbi:conserved repeat domain protein [Lysobacter gummosus]|nr:conserved repeat domain protein [Lysobacter gummosus]